MKALFIILCSLFSLSAFASKPVCHASSGGYCQYTGKVSKIYVNASSQILLHFDEAMDQGEPSKAGFDANNLSAGIIVIEDNPEFAKMFYSTALSAQASKRSVTIQMRGVYGNYLKIDRIWLSE